MLPSGPLVMVIASGGADLTNTYTAPASTRTAKSRAAMVMARLTPSISIIIVSRPGWLLARPPALVESVKLLDSLSRFIAWQPSLPDPLAQGQNPGHVPG